MRQARTTAWRLYEDMNGHGRTRQKHEPEFFEEQAALSGACEIAPAQPLEEGVAGACDDEYAVGAPGEVHLRQVQILSPRHQGGHANTAVYAPLARQTSTLPPDRGMRRDGGRGSFGRGHSIVYGRG
jgi:hypothetical protein